VVLLLPRFVFGFVYFQKVLARFQHLTNAFFLRIKAWSAPVGRPARAQVQDNLLTEEPTREPKPDTMWIVAIAWMYVATMMAIAEGTSPQGTWLGATITFVLYGLAPMSLVMYLLATPMRRKAIRAREQAERDAARQQAAASASPAPVSATPPSPPDAP
jgi:hypothetical protein